LPKSPSIPHLQSTHIRETSLQQRRYLAQASGMPQPRWSDLAGAQVGNATGTHPRRDACTKLSLHSSHRHPAHRQPLETLPTTEGYFCAECHGTGADAGSQPGHKNGTRDLTLHEHLIGSEASPPGTCDVYCHSPNINDPKTDPTWGISSVGCTDCHRIPRSQPGTERHHIPA